MRNLTRLVGVLVACTGALMGQAMAPKATTPVGANPGDIRKVEFTLPFKDALAKAKKEGKLLFFKPIYGGVNLEGALDYCAGTW